MKFPFVFGRDAKQNFSIYLWLLARCFIDILILLSWLIHSLFLPWKVWGSDSESEGEEDLRDEDGTGGVTEHMASELVAKDNRAKEDSDEDDVSEKENRPQETSFDELNEEYEGEKPDPMINASPSKVSIVFKFGYTFNRFMFRKILGLLKDPSQKN